MMTTRFGKLKSYARWGSRKKIMVVFSGGPGNSIPTGLGLKLMTKSYDPFAKEYTIYLVTRKIGQPKGYTTREMSNDYRR